MSSDRLDFFDGIYAEAGADPSTIGWADLAPKAELTDWLARNPGKGRRAMDVACGLGDNAEGLAAAGWDVTAFEYSERAVRWARERFADSAVDYRVADLADLPESWRGAYELVHECYTLQALPPDTLAWTIPAITSLVAPGGTLLVYSRWREGGAAVEGPPWPLERSRLDAFANHGLVLKDRSDFVLHKGERRIPHVFDQWRRPE